jgi:hypothetical protein
MIVDSAEIDVCLSDDRPDRNGMKALFGKQPSARLDQACARTVMVLAGRVPAVAVDILADIAPDGYVDLVDYDRYSETRKTVGNAC